jgi:hypothetical protein
VGVRASKNAASANSGRSRMPRPHPPMPLPLVVMSMLFNENAANSSLRRSFVTVLAGCHPNWNRPFTPMLAVSSRSSHNPCLPRSDRA